MREAIFVILLVHLVIVYDAYMKKDPPRCSEDLIKRALVIGWTDGNIQARKLCVGQLDQYKPMNIDSVVNCLIE